MAAEAGQMPDLPVLIREIREPGELKIVENLAWKIFPATYCRILTPEQIRYMMQMMYDEAVLRKEFSGGMHFALICDGENPVGYVSWHGCDGGIKLEKLYLDFAYHGRGIGQTGLNFVIHEAEKAGAEAVLLNVNKENARAQKAYLRAGFVRFRSEKNPIGNGYFMDDYVMRHEIRREVS